MLDNSLTPKRFNIPNLDESLLHWLRVESKYLQVSSTSYVHQDVVFNAEYIANLLGIEAPYQSTRNCHIIDYGVTNKNTTIFITLISKKYPGVLTIYVTATAVYAKVTNDYGTSKVFDMDIQGILKMPDEPSFTAQYTIDDLVLTNGISSNNSTTSVRVSSVYKICDLLGDSNIIAVLPDDKSLSIDRPYIYEKLLLISGLDNTKKSLKNEEQIKRDCMEYSTYLFHAALSVYKGGDVSKVIESYGKLPKGLNKVSVDVNPFLHFLELKYNELIRANIMNIGLQYNNTVDAIKAHADSQSKITLKDFIELSYFDSSNVIDLYQHIFTSTGELSNLTVVDNFDTYDKIEELLKTNRDYERIIKSVKFNFLKFNNTFILYTDVKSILHASHLTQSEINNILNVLFPKTQKRQWIKTVWDKYISLFKS